MHLANGWRPFSSFVERLLPVDEVNWLPAADSGGLAMIRAHYKEDEISDEEYLDYSTDKSKAFLRHRYYADCLLVGKGWPAASEMILLNSRIVFPDGEWEAIFFANWIPGNQRYRSFRELVEASVISEETAGKG